MTDCIDISVGSGISGSPGIARASSSGVVPQRLNHRRTGTQ